MTAAESRAAPSADGVDFVDKDDAGLILFRHIEKVAHTAGADADVHFDEVGAGNGEERHARLSRDGFREQGFPVPGGPTRARRGESSRRGRRTFWESSKIPRLPAILLFLLPRRRRPRNGL